ncbi:thiamine pyrophosphate-binding protein [Corynebacterium sp.]|uniref:thiamine pyrophosphate-binding protein n=1 Tax=Corynebacterium sp. TaxID=1720 RepID=UPI0025C648B7|nr:thiamine pyrophosphate-binding protein [Corynebacterium sp.]
MTNKQDSGTADGVRIGGDVVLETLRALGARGVIGLPGQHALGLFDALRRSDLHYLGARVENNAGFMADGFSRARGVVAPLLLSTGPGALTSLAALQEAAASSIPVLALSAQVPVAGLGGGRHGYLHELPMQSDSFRGVVKHVVTVRNLSQIPTAVADAWCIAATAPKGPVLVEIPQDILLEDAGEIIPQITGSDLADRAAPRPLEPISEVVDRAVELLDTARKPVILAGGGVVRSAAERELTSLAERLDAPVVSTIGGKSALPWAHPLSARSWIEDIATTEFLEEADVLLIVGSGVGELSSNYHTFAPQGKVIQVEADLGKLGSNHRGIGIHADARLTLALFDDLLESRGRVSDPHRRADAVHRVNSLLKAVSERIAGQPLDKERRLIDGLRESVPDDTRVYWDMTVLAYWAWSAWDVRNDEFASAQGAGGLGYGFPAALGSAFGRRIEGEHSSVLAVSGDGGALYGIAELAVAAQEKLPVVWFIVDDGGYGILREYMEGAFGTATATELTRPDYVQLAESFGVKAESTTIEDAPAAVARALASGEPRVVVLRAVLDLFAPTHLDRVSR